MASVPTITNIPPPRMQIVDPRTGLITREWYLWLLNIFTLTGGGSNPVSLEDLQLGPPSVTADELLALMDDGPPDGQDAAWQALTGVQAVSDALFKEPAALDVSPLEAQIQALALEPVPQPAPLMVEQGIYTPTLTGVANVDATTAAQCMYIRIGNTVSVSGLCAVDATVAATITDVGVSLPFPSTLTASANCTGNATGYGFAIVGSLFGDVANNRANLRFLPVDTSSRAVFFTFMYRIL